MKSVYIFGPIYLHGVSFLPVYKKLRELCIRYFKKVVCTYPDFWETNETPAQFYKRTYDTITKCDLFIGETSLPSSGVGMEFQMGQEKGIPAIAICKQGLKPSPMVLGIPSTKDFIYYKDINDLVFKLEKLLKEKYFNK